MACSNCGPITLEIRNELAKAVYVEIVAKMPIGGTVDAAMRKAVVAGTAAVLRVELASWKVSASAELDVEKGGVKLKPAYAGVFLGDIYGTTLRDQMIGDFSAELDHVLALTPDGTAVTTKIVQEVAQTATSGIEHSTKRFECRFNPRSGVREWYDTYASRWTSQSC